MPILIISFMDGLLRLVANASLAHLMPFGGRPPQHVLLYGISAKKDVDHRDKPGDDAESVEHVSANLIVSVHRSRTFIHRPSSSCPKMNRRVRSPLAARGCVARLRRRSGS